MKTKKYSIENIREDLKEIRYYYTNKTELLDAEKYLSPNALVQKIELYKTLIKFAPINLYYVYYCLYILGQTQECCSYKLHYTIEYIQKLNHKLLEYFHKFLSI